MNDLRCARLCALTYRYANIEDPDTDIQAIVEKKDDCLVIAFRGTSSRLDWWTNIQFNHLVYPWKHDYEGDVRMHSGIARSYKSIRDRLFEFVQNHDPQLPIITTGHSQGGMLAFVAAVDLQYNERRFDRTSVRCVAFGAPAAGNRAYRESARSRISYVNYVLLGDPVPFLLPRNRHLNLTWIKKLYLNPHKIDNYAKGLAVGR